MISPPFLTDGRAHLLSELNVRPSSSKTQSYLKYHQHAHMVLIPNGENFHGR